MAVNPINHFDEELQKFLITSKTEAKEIEPVITISNSVFAIKGGLSMITGLPKGGKTTVVKIMIETAYMNEIYEGYDCLNIRTVHEPDKSVIYVNTEMTDADMVKFRNQICKHLQVDSMPDTFHIFHFLTLSPQRRMQLIEKAVEQAGNAVLLLIDGYADLVGSVNEEKECNEVVQKLQNIAQKYQVAVVGVIHENRGNQNTRGHIGQQLERKCVSSISVKKIREKKLFEIKSNMTRHSEDFEPIHYQYNQEGRLQLISEAMKEVVKFDKKKEEIEFCKLVFGIDKQLKNTEVRERLRNHFKKETPDAKLNAITNKVTRTLDKWFTDNLVDVADTGIIAFNKAIEEVYA
ncbi:AAA family ATPase [Emticicia fontis]